MLGITGFFAVMTPVTLGNDTWVVLVSGQGYRWRERMTSLSFHSGGALPPQRHARSSTCPPQHRPQRDGHGHQGWCRVSPERTARGWAATGGGWGVLRVGGAFVQYAQPLASGSRPSWSRSAQGGSLGADVVPMAFGSCAGLARVQKGAGFAAKPRRLRSCRCQVFTALTLTSPTSKHPNRDRWNAAVSLRRSAPKRR